MVTCPSCGRSGSLADFAYLGQATEAGPFSLRRCPGCGEQVVVDELELEGEGPSSSGPWGLSDVWGRRFTLNNGEV